MKMWLGYNLVKEFIQPDKTVKKFGNICWFTNLNTKKRNETLILYKTYNPTDYPTYDNYDAINVDKVKDIPIDYMGVMGVPITFMDKHNPKQFEILAAMTTTKVDDYNFGYPYINGIKKYARILIKHKPIQFEIVDCNDFRTTDNVPYKSHGLVKDKEAKIGDRICYARILIKRTEGSEDMKI